MVPGHEARDDAEVAALLSKSVSTNVMPSTNEGPGMTLELAAWADAMAKWSGQQDLNLR
jgi:hypothetical protein